MRIAGIDPSLRNTGVIIYDTPSREVIVMDTIKTAKGQGEESYAGFDGVGRAYHVLLQLKAWDLSQCDYLAVEVPSGAKDANAAKALGITTGVAGWLATLFQDKLLPVKPIWVKDDTIGKAARLAEGTAAEKKRRIIDWAEDTYPDAPWVRNKQGIIQANQEHVADALAIMHSGLKRYNLLHLLEEGF